MNINANNRSKVSFGSRIKLISYDEFKDIYKIGTKVIDNDNNFCSNSGNNVILSKKAWAYSIQCCISGGLTNLKNVLMWHFHPGSTVKDFNKMHHKLDEGFDKLSQESDNFGGLIIGGWQINHESKQVFKELTGKLQSYKEDLLKKVSILWNEDGEISCASYSAKDDTWLAVVWDLYKYGKSEEHMLKSVSEQFSDRSICSSDEVFVGGKKINNGLINSKTPWWQNSRQ